MKLHKILFLVAIIFTSLKATAQDLPGCGTVEPDEEKLKMLPSYNILMNEQNHSNARLAAFSNTKYRFKVRAHALIKPATSNSSVDMTNISESEIEELITTLNTAFDPVNFEFVVCGVNYIKVADHNMKFYMNGQRTLDETTYCDPNDVQGYINIYFMNTLYFDGTEAAGKADFPEWDVEKNLSKGIRIIINHNKPNSLIHEMGHFFNLYHTFHSEKTGTERADGTNCANDGDYVCDTPAEPSPGSTEGKSNFNFDCAYIGKATDAYGTAYAPLNNNYMTYAQPHCRTNFTPGQIKRMQVTGWSDRSDLGITYQAEFSYAISGNTYQFPLYIPDLGTTNIKMPVKTVSASILTSTSTISGGSDIKYYADGKIVLKKGFKASSDSKFRAKVVDFCSMPADGGALASAYRTLAQNRTEGGNIEIEEDLFEIYPNPSDGKGTIRLYTASSALVQVRMYDALGILVYTNQYEAPFEGHHIFDFNLDGNFSGLYTVQLEKEGKIHIRKLVITR